MLDLQSSKWTTESQLIEAASNIVEALEAGKFVLREDTHRPSRLILHIPAQNVSLHPNQIRKLFFECYGAYPGSIEKESDDIRIEIPEGRESEREAFFQKLYEQIPSQEDTLADHTAEDVSNQVSKRR